jgi:parvulin-like peptidyl-prolyl isomerase
MALRGRWARLGLLASLVLLAPLRALPAVDAARVNGVGIPRQRLDRYFEEHAARQGRSVAHIQSPTAYRRLLREALDELVDEELLAQDAEREGLAPTPAEVARAMAAERAATPGPAQFDIRLDREGFTEASFEAHLRRRIAVERLVRRDILDRVRVTDEEVHAFHAANAAQIGRPEPEVRELIRAHLEEAKARAALRARVEALRRAAKVEILVPLEGRP